MEQKGFTLIELMITVAIVGILASVAIPAFNSYIVKAKISTIFVLLQGEKTKIYEYYQDYGIMPDATADVVTTVTAALETTPSTQAVSYTKQSDNQASFIVTLGTVGADASNTDIEFVFAASGASYITILCNGAGTTLPEFYQPQGCK